MSIWKDMTSWNVEECGQNSASEYSENEMVLFKHYGFDNICHRIMPYTLYKMMAEKAFLANDQSEYAEAVRKGLLALNSRTPYRLTTEFDNLIVIRGK